MVFEGHIVSDGHRHIEGVTSKALPSPDASHTLPNLDTDDEKLNDINASEA